MKRLLGKAMTKEQCIDTGMAVVLMALLAYVGSRHRVFLIGAIVLHVLNMIWPRLYGPIAVVWMGLSDFLGATVSKLVLALLFFTIVTPIGILRRLTGKDSLRLRAFKAGEDSVMFQRNHLFSPGDIEKPY